MLFKKLVIILIVMCFVSLMNNLNFAQDEAWFEATGLAAVHGTAFEATEQAKMNAMARALNQACGTTITGLSTVKDGTLLHSIMLSENLGTILDETKTRIDSFWNEVTRPELPAAIMCKSWWKFKIKCVDEKPDPTFVLDLNLNGVNFIEGEDVILNVASSKNCYLYIFCLAGNDECYLLYPNSYHGNNALAANIPVEIPDKQEREGYLGMKLELYTGFDRFGQKKRYVTETMIAVATKQQMPVIGLGQEYNYTPKITIRKMKHTDFNAWLIHIPIKERAVALAGYSIISRDQKIR